MLVPSQELASALRLPGLEPILWQLNDARHQAPEAEVLITERPRELDRRRVVARIPGLRHVHLLSLGFEWVLEHLPDGVGLSTSRGAIEDATAEHALALVLAELEAGRLGAALDVTDPEPLPPWHRLWSAPNCLVTPHIGGNTTQVSRLCGQLAVGVSLN